MSAKTMAEVLHLHGDWWWDGKAHCDGCHWSHASTILQAAAAFREHQADRLSAAGFGLVADAKAEAWDHGFASGKSRAMRAMSDEPSLPLTAPNPYRATI